MSTVSIREQYEQAWQELFALVGRRNKLLRRLNEMARLAMDVAPTAGLVIEFDVSRAERLVAEIDTLTGAISAAIQNVNNYAEQCAAPSVKWQNIAVRVE